MMETAYVTEPSEATNDIVSSKCSGNKGTFIGKKFTRGSQVSLLVCKVVSVYTVYCLIFSKFRIWPITPDPADALL